MTKAVLVIAGLALVLAACAERMAGARSDKELGKICTDLGAATSTYQYDRCIEVLRHEY